MTTVTPYRLGAGYTEGETLVHLDHVSLRLNGNLILADIDDKVPDIHVNGRIAGQIIGIAGPSGVGKTQLSRCLAGLEKPTSGSIKIGPEGKPACPGMLGLVSQNSFIFPHRTVLGNLLVAGKKAGLSYSEAKEKAVEYLDRFGIRDLAERFAPEISGGQRQRVAILQQLMSGCHYLVMDEPTTGLDPDKKRIACEQILQISVMAEENTIFINSHDIPSLVKVCDFMWLLGRDRDTDGKAVPGSKIQARYNLIEMGLAWHPELSRSPHFFDFCCEIEDRFANL